MKKSGRQKSKETAFVTAVWKKMYPGKDDTRMDIVQRCHEVLAFWGIDATGSKNEMRARVISEIEDRRKRATIEPGRTPPLLAHPLPAPQPTIKKQKKVKVRGDLPRRPPPPSKEMKEAFYSSWEWTALRMEVLKEQGRRCLCCGAEAGDDVGGGVRARIVVDHIKPLSLHWGMRLDRSNLQVLCHICNKGKSNVHEDDFRAA